MKHLVIFTLLIFVQFSVYSQNILEALQLKESSIGEYVEGELTSTDTIVDLRNGYYEEFSLHQDSKKKVLRQASLFLNNDGSKMLGVSICKWDFQCFVYKTNFYEILKSKDSISSILDEDVLPHLTIKEFVADTIVFSILNKYLPTIQENYLDSNATIDKVLSEIYDIVYIMPQGWTILIATLKVCDYIPTNVVTISPNDWSIIENSVLLIELEYDKTQKKFMKKKR